MGKLSVEQLEPAELRSFVRHLLRDVRALERMLRRGMIESGKSRIGCEQEMFLVDRAWRPLPAVIETLNILKDDHFTTELGRFNLEVNLDCIDFEADCLSRMEQNLNRYLTAAREAVGRLGGEILLIGILPTLRKSDLSLENLTPKPRYRALNDAMTKLRGGDYQFQLKGADELIVTQDSVMLESACTSFQVHYQTDPDEFVPLYNIAQAITAPLLAAAVNSPMLFGRRLWQETRIPLFRQAIDTRRATSSLRERSARVSFGECWLSESVVEIFREEIARFRVLLGTEAEEDSIELVNRGEAPKLSALQAYNGTVYRWNRACYGWTKGVPHLRIENRVLPAGPSVLDEVANAALFFGLMRGMSRVHPNISRIMAFDDADLNFMTAAQNGLGSRFRWIGGRSVSARDLLLDELIPIARAGLQEAGLVHRDIDRYLGVLSDRVSAGRTGSQWMLESVADMKGERRDAVLTGVTAATADRQWGDAGPGFGWQPATIGEGKTMQHAKIRIEESMTTDLFTIHPDEPVDLVINLMDWKRIRHVPVEDEKGSVIGLVSYSEVLGYVNRGGREEQGPLAVRAIMDPNPVTAPPETPVGEAIALMNERHADCLLVVHQDHLVGIVTEHDILNLAAHLIEQSGSGRVVENN